MPQNRVHDIVVGDECDDPHLASALRAKQRVYLADTLDELRPAPAEGTGVGAMISVGLNQGGMLDGSRRSAYSRTVNGTCHAGDMILRKTMPEVYAATVRDIKGFAESL